MSSLVAGGDDAYYTPHWLAREVAAFLPDDLVGSVLDPTVGGGALLSAVCERFAGDVRPLGIDIDRNTVRRLRSSEPTWVVSRANLLSAASRSASRAWREAKADVAAVIINPPFSYRGNQGAPVSFGDFHGRVAPAMHFLVELMNELKPGNGFYAILPDGALDAEKHYSLWREVGREFTVERLEKFKTTSFRGARVSTTLVHLRPRSSPSEHQVRHPKSDVMSLVAGARCCCVEVVRGRVPVHAVKGAEVSGPTAAFLHTTSLSRMQTLGDMQAAARLGDDAPLVLLTRVGRWSSPVAVEIGRVVLSDCLIGLRPRDRAEIDRLREDIERSHQSFRNLFKGTGAQYLTLKSVVELLDQIGWRPSIVKASSEVAPCSCGHYEKAITAPGLGSVDLGLAVRQL